MKNEKIIVNILSLSNGITDKNFCTNPFIHNTLGLADMLMREGFHVRVFAAEGSQVNCSELIEVVPIAILERNFGKDFREQKIDFNTLDKKHPARIFEANAIQELEERAKPGEFLCAMAGPSQKPICDELTFTRQMEIVEPAFGYETCFSRYRVFPSYAWMHYNYGIFHGNWDAYKEQLPEDQQYNSDLFLTTAAPQGHVQPYDAVIPHYIFPDEFTPAEDGPDDYMLQLSRVIPSKGIKMAVDAAERLGRKLIIAGHGDFQENMGFKPPKHVECIGPVLGEERSKLMAKAWCMTAWTHYVEAFGLSAVENNFADRPTVASKKGAFVETITDGVNGYTVGNDLDKFCEAVEKCGSFKKGTIRKHAMDNFSIEAIAPKYGEYFLGLHRHING